MVALAPKSSPRPRRWVRRASFGPIRPRWCADTSSNRTGLSTVARRRDPRRHRSSKADIPDKARQVPARSDRRWRLFLAGFAVGLLRGWPAARAARFGNWCGARAVEVAGIPVVEHLR